jgi:uncharacterized protein (DUF697 family)
MLPNNHNPRHEWLTIFGGALFIIVCNLIISIFAANTVYSLLYKLFGNRLNRGDTQGFTSAFLAVSCVWIYQIIYVLPLVLFWRYQRQFAMMKGVIIGSVITALIAGSCFVLFASAILQG